MISNAERIPFLKKIHLFRDLKDNEIAGIADKLMEYSYKPDETIFAEGSDADGLYMVFQGRTRAVQVRQDRKIPLAIFTKSDYFGEEGAFTGRKRSASMEAEEETLVFHLSRTDFNNLIRKYPKIKPNFQVSIRSRRLARKTLFKWLNTGEVVYFVNRKHPLVLAQALVGPVFALIAATAFLGWALLVNSIIASAAGTLAVIVILGWALWNYIDWGNDYYIVTNQRVVWLEKVVGLYDSRQEAPLGTVLSVSVETEQLGRILDYGSVIIRTFVGQIIFDHVNHPEQAARMIEEQWDRVKAGNVKNEKDKLIDAIRTKMGLTGQGKPAPPKQDAIFNHPQQESLTRLVLKNLFRLKVEEGSTVTYRKHWYVLWLQVWKPTFFIVILFIFMIRRGWDMFQNVDKALITRSATGGLSMDAIFFGLPILMIPFLIWWVYQYMDWSNDTFQVTSDSIIDIDRKPFGEEERKSAQIDNILGTQYKRIGVAGYFLNFGTVYITVGGMQMAFEDVLDPASVQADIDRRRATKLAKKKESEASAERDRMATWLAIYHQTRNQILDQEEDKKYSGGTRDVTAQSQAANNSTQPAKNDSAQINTTGQYSAAHAKTDAVAKSSDTDDDGGDFADGGYEDGESG